MRYLLVLLLMVALVVGYFRGWFEFSANTDRDRNQETAAITINKNQIQKDVGQVTDKAREGVNSIWARSQPAPKTTETTTRGQIEDVGQGKVTVRTPDDKVLTFGVVPSTVVQVGDRPATMADLHKDDPVAVVHTDGEEQHVAVSVTVENRQ